MTIELAEQRIFGANNERHERQLYIYMYKCKVFLYIYIYVKFQIYVKFPNSLNKL